MNFYNLTLCNVPNLKLRNVPNLKLGNNIRYIILLPGCLSGYITNKKIFITNCCHTRSQLKGLVSGDGFLSKKNLLLSSVLETKKDENGIHFKTLYVRFFEQWKIHMPFVPSSLSSIHKNHHLYSTHVCTCIF